MQQFYEHKFGDLGVLRRARAPGDSYHYSDVTWRGLFGVLDFNPDRIDVNTTQRLSCTPAFLHQTRIQKSRILLNLDPTQVLSC